MMLKEKSLEKELELHNLPLELKDAGNEKKELYGSFRDGSNTVRLLAVQTGIDVIENSKITKLEKAFRSEHQLEITLGFLTTTKHCDFDGRIKSVEFVFLRDEKDKTPLKASVDFEKEINSQFSKLPDAMIRILKEHGIIGEYASIGMNWEKSGTSLSDTDKRMHYFDEDEIGKPYKLAHSQTISFEWRMFSKPGLAVTETVVAGGKKDSYGEVMSASLIKTYEAERGFTGTQIHIMYQDQEGKPHQMYPDVGGYAYVSDEKEITQIINNPKAADFKEMVERNRELMKVKPNDVSKSLEGS